MAKDNQSKWKADFEKAVVKKNKKLAGKIDWDTAAYLFKAGEKIKDAVAIYLSMNEEIVNTTSGGAASGKENTTLLAKKMLRRRKRKKDTKMDEAKANKDAKAKKLAKIKSRKKCGAGMTRSVKGMKVICTKKDKKKGRETKKRMKILKNTKAFKKGRKKASATKKFRSQ